MEFVLDPVRECDAIVNNPPVPPQTPRKADPSALALSQPVRLALLHIGAGLFRQENLAALDLGHRPVDLFANRSLVLV